jgi:hypothetical protein
VVLVAASGLHTNPYRVGGVTGVTGQGAQSANAEVPRPASPAFRFRESWALGRRAQGQLDGPRKDAPLDQHTRNRVRSRNPLRISSVARRMPGLAPEQIRTAQLRCSDATGRGPSLG